MFCKKSLITFMLSFLITSGGFASQDNNNDLFAKKDVYVATKPGCSDLHFVMRRVSKENLGFWSSFAKFQLNQFVRIFAENPHWKCNALGQIQFEESNDDKTTVATDQEVEVNTERSSASVTPTVLGEVQTATAHEVELSYAKMICLSSKLVPLIKTDRQCCKGHPDKVPVTPDEIERCRNHDCAIRTAAVGIGEGLGAFWESLSLYNDSSELWVAYAVSGFDPKIVFDTTGYIWPHIEMVMTVFTAPEVNFTMHMGICRTVYHEEAAFKGLILKHPGISVDLHAFAAKIMLSHNKKWMCTRPVTTMRNILSLIFGKDCYIGSAETIEKLLRDEFDPQLNVIMENKGGHDPLSPLSFLNHRGLLDDNFIFCVLNLGIMANRMDCHVGIASSQRQVLS